MKEKHSPFYLFLIGGLILAIGLLCIAVLARSSSNIFPSSDTVKDDASSLRLTVLPVRPKIDPWFDYCLAADRQIGGRLSVVLLNADGARCYPNDVSVRNFQPSTSVIKLQIVACFLTTMRGRMNEGGIDWLEFCRKTISKSDNITANQLIAKLGISAINQYCAKLGLNSTQMQRQFSVPSQEGRNYTSAWDQVEFLRGLWEGKVLPADQQKLLLGWMRHTEKRIKIPLLLDGFEIYNKTGESWDLPVQNDVAIVKHGDKIWYLAILTCDSLRKDTEVRQAIATLARQLITGE